MIFGLLGFSDDPATLGIGAFLVFGLVFWLVARSYKNDRKKEEEEHRRDRLSPDERAMETFGELNAAMICPHCQTKGFIRTKKIEKKGGVSGSKAAGAVVTGGLSVLVTGLSSVDTLTQSHCDQCGNTWVF